MGIVSGGGNAATGAVAALGLEVNRAFVASTTAAVQSALDDLLATAANRAVLVCVEGPGGAGKSTVAGAIAQDRPDVTVVHGDDFYGPETRDWQSWTPQQGYERYFNHARLENQLLRPQAGRNACFQRYDWSRNTLADWVDVTPAGLVVVEGVYLLRSRLRHYWDLAIYVDAPRELRQRRLYARGENDAGWIDRWGSRRGLLRGH